MTKFRELEGREYVDSDKRKIHVRSEDIGRDFKGMVVYSYYDREQIIGIAGATRVNDNTCEVWIILDECSKRYIREIYFYAVKSLDDLQRYYERIQAIVRTDWPVAIRFMERLGFVKEGLMRKFGPDRDDFYLYGRIR